MPSLVLASTSFRKTLVSSVMLLLGRSRHSVLLRYVLWRGLVASCITAIPTFSTQFTRAHVVVSPRLHLNEDIFAGMNAFGRGGQIKHSEYYQCGKGRDFGGFGTILNFQTKIGHGHRQTSAQSGILLLHGHATASGPVLDILLWTSWFPYQQCTLTFCSSDFKKLTFPLAGSSHSLRSGFHGCT